MPDLVNIIVWLILGGISGWIASLITSKDSEMGIGSNILVGILGAVLGGWLTGIFGWGPATGLNIWSFFVSIGGSVILLAILSMIKGKSE
ncbi:MAG TPA: GlsB/YeaQ/YmgE family stress response membrane protein [Clostridiales bacterium]|nr:GlsB/YeaQ/YmgE family stress response membrane protein [Clostridiales bacterium]